MSFTSRSLFKLGLRRIIAKDYNLHLPFLIPKRILNFALLQLYLKYPLFNVSIKSPNAFPNSNLIEYTKSIFNTSFQNTVHSCSGSATASQWRFFCASFSATCGYARAIKMLAWRHVAYVADYLFHACFVTRF